VNVSGIRGVRPKKNESEAKLFKNKKAGLQKVYGNIVDLVFLEEENMKDGMTGG